MDRTVRPGRVEGTLTPPCSKSYAQRALAAALLAEGETVLRNIEFCDDTRSAMHCIETLGAEVRREGEDVLRICGGLNPRGDRLTVGESGLATRLFTPVASLCGTPITIEGRGTLLGIGFVGLLYTFRLTQRRLRREARDEEQRARRRSRRSKRR